MWPRLYFPWPVLVALVLDRTIISADSSIGIHLAAQPAAAAVAADMGRPTRRVHMLQPTTAAFPFRATFPSNSSSIHRLIQGISYWNIKSNLGLRDINMLIGLCLKVSVWSWGLDIWVLSTNFQKSNIDWSQQPPIKKVLKFSKNFHDFVENFLVLRLLNSRTRIPLKSSVVIFQALETSTASLTSVASAASAISLASTASTAPLP